MVHRSKSHPNMSGFFEELQRRKVYRVAAAYIIAAGFIIQISSAVFPAWELPNWAFRLVVVLLLIGFPIALILAWAYDITAARHPRNSDAQHARIASSAQCDNADRDRRDHLRWSGISSFCPECLRERSTSRLPSCPSKISAMKRRTLTSPTACRTIS